MEIGAVYVGPKDAIGATVQHWLHGGGHVQVFNGDAVVVDFYGSSKVFATAFAQQKPKLIKTNSETGHTCIANVKAIGNKVVNKDDGKLIGYVNQTTHFGWTFQCQINMDVKDGFSSKHLAIKALVNYNNTTIDSLAINHAVAKYTVVQPPVDPWATAPAIPNIITDADVPAIKKPEPVKKPEDGAPWLDEAWKSVKQELQGNLLVGANPVKNADGQIVSGEIHFNGVVVGYTKSNFDGTMKVFHADGTLVAPTAVPGAHTATDMVAAHHTEFHSGMQELIAELTAKIKNTVVNGKIAPTELSLSEGGLHHHPVLAYTGPSGPGVLNHFRDQDSHSAGEAMYAKVAGAHLLDLATTWKSSLKHYTANGYVWINNQLRANAIKHPTVANHITRLDKIFTKTPELEETITVYRGIDHGTASTLFGELGSHVGKEFIELGFSSCSAVAASAFTNGMNIVMRITVPKGAHVVKPSLAGHYKDQECEIILPREAKFMVMRDEHVGIGFGAKRQIDLVFTGSILN